MDVKFKAQFPFTKDYLKNLHTYMYFLRPYRLIINIILLICFLLSIYMYFVQKEDFLFTIWFVPLFFVYEVFVYFRGFSIGMKRYQETKSEDTSITYEFFDDYFRFTSSLGTAYTVEYISIKKFINTKDFVILISKAKRVYWFPIDSLDNADLESFKKFLGEKGIKVQ